MLDQLKVAEVSVHNITETDWSLACNFAGKELYLQPADSDAYISFRWFEHDWSVLVTLGTVFIDPKLNRELDVDVYKLAIDNKLSSYFADIITKARKEGFDYLVLDPGKDGSRELPIVYDT